MHSLEEARALVEIANEQTAEAKAFLDFYMENPQYACDANTALFKEFHHGETVTLQSLRESVAFLGEQLAVKNNKRMERDQAEERTNLLSEYREAISGWSPEAVQSELSKARYWTNDEIKEKLISVREKKTLQTYEPSALRKIIKDHTPAPEEIELPSQHTRASMLAMTGPAFKALCDRYPLNVITKALNERR